MERNARQSWIILGWEEGRGCDVSQELIAGIAGLEDKKRSSYTSCMLKLFI